MVSECEKGKSGHVCSCADDRRHNTSELMGYNYKAVIMSRDSTDLSQRHYLLSGIGSCTGHGQVQVG